MKRKAPLKNVAASVRARLKQITDTTGQDFNTLLTRYAIERLLFRLSNSKHRNRFVLKGAILFALWGESPHRVTRDLDLLGFGNSSIGEMEKVFQEICAQETLDDGVVFVASSVEAEPIRAHELYVGVRVGIEGKIGNARIPLQIDVGFGDATAVKPVDVKFPSLLGMPAAKLRAYRMESALAEKFETAVTLGILNSRMKDYYDFWFLATHHTFDGQELADSIGATFNRRGREIPTEAPVGFSEAFWSDSSRQQVWRAFWRKSVKRDPALSLETVVTVSAEFLLPPAIAAAKNEKFFCQWQKGGPWRKGIPSPI